MALNHKHLIVRGHIMQTTKSEDVLSRMLNDVVNMICMRVMMGPYSKYLDVQGNRGITGVVVIETSHLSCHIWDEQFPHLIQLDIYSCKDFDPQVVINVVDSYFCFIDYQIMVIDRNEGLKLLKEESV